LATGRAGAQVVKHQRQSLSKDIGYLFEWLEREGRTEGEIGSLARASLSSLATYIA
jgi:hypothetical protein